MDWSSTVRKLERAFARDPRSLLFLPLAEAHRELGHYARAAELLQTGIKHHPGHLRARIGLARTLLLMGLLEQARQELDEVISLVPDNVMARRLLAELHAREGALDRAEAEYRTLLRYQPGAVDVQHELSRLGDRLAGRPAPGQAAASQTDRSPDTRVLNVGLPQLPGSSSSMEEFRVSESDSKSVFNPGIGVEASRQSEQSAEPERPASGAEAEFRDAFDLPAVQRASGPIDFEAVLQLFFPGAFGGTPIAPAPEPVAAAASRPAKEEALVGPGASIQTLSLVQLYIDQGFMSEAREMLEQIVAADPSNFEAWEKLESLRAGAVAVEAGSAEDILKRWVGAIETLKRKRGLAVLG